MAVNRRGVIAGCAALWPCLASAKAASTAFTRVECRRLKDDELRLDWMTSPSPTAVVVLSSFSADGPFSWNRGKVTDGAWQGPGSIRPRPYFRLSTPGGATETAERVLPLAGGRNFRDLGGYRSVDGRMVRWGRLYRSGVMSELTDTDYGYLSSLGIAVICDFRSTPERNAAPDRWVGPNPPQVYTRDYEMDESTLRALASKGGATAADTRAAMIATYVDLPYAFADSYRRMFAEILAHRLPLTFNCSAGKDRSGVAAALILTALDVPHEQVVIDYTLSEKVVNDRRLSQQPPAPHGASGFEFIQKLPPEALAPLGRSDPAYLAAAFTEIERRDGSVANYLSSRLGVGPREVKELQRTLLKRV